MFTIISMVRKAEAQITFDETPPGTARQIRADGE